MNLHKEDRSSEESYTFFCMLSSLELVVLCLLSVPSYLLSTEKKFFSEYRQQAILRKDSEHAGKEQDLLSLFVPSFTYGFKLAPVNTYFCLEPEFRLVQQ